MKNWLRALGILIGSGAVATAFMLISLKFVFFQNYLGIAALAVPSMALALWALKSTLDEKR